MTPHLIIRYSTTRQAYQVTLVASDSVLVEAKALTDVRAIAKSLSSWTHLHIYEAVSGF